MEPSSTRRPTVAQMALTQRARDCKALRPAAPFSPRVLRYLHGLVAAWFGQANQGADTASQRPDYQTASRTRSASMIPSTRRNRTPSMKRSSTFCAMLHAWWNTSGTAAVPPELQHQPESQRFGPNFCVEICQVNR